MPWSTTSSFTEPFLRYRFTPINLRSCEYLSALLTRFTRERARASRSTRMGGTGSIFFFESKALLLDLVLVGLKGVAHELADIGLAEVVFLAARLDTREVEDIVD